jgi:hypothetical protein
MKRDDLSPLAVNTVFISSTARDLRAFRQAVAWAGQQQWGVKESFPESDWSSATSPNEIVAECRRRVLSADAFILFLGPWAGWTPPGYTESITHLEFQWARSHFAELHKRIGEFAKKWTHMPELARLDPRILVLTAGSHDLRQDRSDGGQGALRIYDSIKQSLAKFTEPELEKNKTSLQKFHQEVSEAVAAREARLYSFNEMEDMQVKVLGQLQQWAVESARILQSGPRW